MVCSSPGVVKSALSFALQRQISQEDESKEGDGAPPLVLCMVDFLRGIKEAKPQYGAQGLEWSSFMSLGFRIFNPRVQSLLEEVNRVLNLAVSGKASLRAIPLLIQGVHGAGKVGGYLILLLG